MAVILDPISRVVKKKIGKASVDLDPVKKGGLNET